MSRASFYNALFVLAPLAFFFLRPFQLVDLSIWIALGRESIAHGSIITSDPFTMTQTAPMIYPALLSLVYAFIYSVGQLDLVCCLHAIVPSLWVLIWISKTRQQGWTAATLAIVTVSLVGTSLFFVPRPALIATLPLVLSYSLLLNARSRELSFREVLALCLIEIVWVNLHGSFLLLPLMIGWQALRSFVETKSIPSNRLVAAAAVAACSLANPFGWKVIPYVWETARVSRLRGLDEWFPIWKFSYPFASEMYLAFSIVFLFLLYRLMLRKRLLDVVFDPYLPIWISGAFAVRNSGFTFLLLPLFFAAYIPQMRARASSATSSVSKVLNVAIIALLLVAIVCLSPYLKNSVSSFLPPEFQAVYSAKTRAPAIDAYLVEHRGLVFNDWIYGSDLALSQPNKHFIDSRNIIFSDAVDAESNLAASDPSSGIPALAKYDFKYYVVSRPNVVDWFSRSSRFKLLLRDGPAFLFEQQGARDPLH